MAAGDVFRKLVGKVICKQLAGPFQAHFCGTAAPGQASAPAQFGVAVRSGAEACVHTVQTALEANPHWVHISLDIANAFNTVHRSAIFREVAASFPQLFAYTQLCYGDSPTLLFKMQGETGVEFGEILSSEGAQQGDPLGTFYWCLANHPVLSQVVAEVPDVLVPSFIDDVNILGPADSAYLAMGKFIELSRARGGVVVPAKSHVYSPVGDLGLFPDEMVVDRSGGSRRRLSTVLKVPVGLEVDVVRDAFGDILRKQQRLLGELHRVPCLQSRGLLLIFCAFPRIGYWTRMAPPHLLLEACKQYDQAVRGGWQQLHPGAPPGEMSLRAAELVGGLAPSSRLCSSAYLSSWYAAQPVMARVFPSLLTQIGDPSSSRLPSLVALQRADVVVGAAVDALRRAAQSNELVPPWAPDVELYSPLHEGGFGVTKPPQRVHAKALLSEDWMSFRSSLAPGEQDWLDSLTFGQLGLKFMRTIPSHPGVRLTTEEYHVPSR